MGVLSRDPAPNHPALRARHPQPCQSPSPGAPKRLCLPATPRGATQPPAASRLHLLAILADFSLLPFVAGGSLKDSGGWTVADPTSSPEPIKACLAHQPSWGNRGPVGRSRAGPGKGVGGLRPAFPHALSQCPPSPQRVTGVKGDRDRARSPSRAGASPPCFPQQSCNQGRLSGRPPPPGPPPTWGPRRLLRGVKVSWGLSQPSVAAHLEPWHSWGPRGAWRADGRALLGNRMVRPLRVKQGQR